MFNFICKKEVMNFEEGLQYLRERCEANKPKAYIIDLDELLKPKKGEVTTEALLFTGISGALGAYFFRKALLTSVKLTFGTKFMSIWLILQGSRLLTKTIVQMAGQETTGFVKAKEPSDAFATQFVILFFSLFLSWLTFDDLEFWTQLLGK